MSFYKNYQGTRFFEKLDEYDSQKVLDFQQIVLNFLKTTILYQNLNKFKIKFKILDFL